MPESALLVPNYVIQGSYGELKQVTNLTSPAAQNEVQAVEVNATGGTFKLNFNGQQTGALAWNIAAAALETALEALPNLDPADVAVTGGPGGTGPLVVTFAGAYAGLNVPQMTADSSLLTGGGQIADVTTSTQGEPIGTTSFLANVHQVQGRFTTAKLEIRRAGTRRMGYKRGMMTGEGTITQFKVTSAMLDKFVTEFSDELSPPADIVLDVHLDDPEALGEEVLRLHAVKLWEVDFGWNVGDLVDESIPFTFEDATLVSAITGTMVA